MLCDQVAFVYTYTVSYEWVVLFLGLGVGSSTLPASDSPSRVVLACSGIKLRLYIHISLVVSWWYCSWGWGLVAVRFRHLTPPLEWCWSAV